MKTKLFRIVLAIAGLAGSALFCKAAEPTPLQIVKYQGEDIPVYATPEVQPRHTAKPEYPQDQRKPGTTGRAELMALVGVDGKVIESQVKESTPSKDFGVAAKAALAKWRFPKLKRSGVPTKYFIQIPFVFSYDNN